MALLPAARPNRRSVAPKTSAEVALREPRSPASWAPSTSPSSCRVSPRSMSGVVAAGHPTTAEAGVEGLRAGGNAVDTAVAAVLASFAAESTLTGFGSGGCMMILRDEKTTLLDFFVAAPGLDGSKRGVELVPVPVHFDADTVQTFYIGPASCVVPGPVAQTA